MPFTTMTQEEAADLYRQTIKGLIPGADTSPGSDYDLMARAAGALFTGNQAQASYLLRQILPDTADATYLARHRDNRDIEPQPAAGATGKVMLLSTSTGDVQGVGATLSHADGTQYELTTSPATSQPTWSASKTVVAGSSRSRLFIDPSTADITVGQIVEVTFGVGDTEKRSVKAIISGASAIDLEEPLTRTPSGGEDITSAIGATAEVKAQNTGATTNKPKGETLTLDSPVGDIQADTRVQDMGGGGDAETDEEVRRRVLDFEASRPGAGNMAQYREWARTTPGVRISDAIVFPGFLFPNLIYIVAIGVEGAREISSSAAQAIEDHIQSVAPFGDDVSVDPVQYDSPDVEVQLDITPERGYEPDWGSGVSSTVDLDTGLTAGNITLELNDDTSIFEIGDRIAVPLSVAGRWNLYERTITNIPSSDKIEIDEGFPVDVASGHTIYPGGPLVSTLVEAVEGVFDNLGPGVTDAAGTKYLRYPDAADAWDYSLQRSRLIGASIRDVTGVDNVVVQKPATDQSPNVGETLRLGKLTIRFEAI